ncbi:hypothetical protein NDU88_002674 [Pleurodeles waltl]|uniref:Uncharacterized protein n=1 Tax=Pleurodeles waltl TaxID=8319 RepID=A0AAV7LJG7_PLEWA|nr:hypothetical protein NDU88_002674 [Pleurodeles waltl]
MPRRRDGSGIQRWLHWTSGPGRAGPGASRGCRVSVKPGDYAAPPFAGSGDGRSTSAMNAIGEPPLGSGEWVRLCALLKVWNDLG